MLLRVDLQQAFVSYCDSYAWLSSGVMHGGRRLCPFFPVSRGLSHRKAALTMPFRTDSQQLSVKYGDLYVWL